MREPRFTPSFVFMLAGFLIWAAHFLLVYAFTGLVCARPAWTTATLLGIEIVPFAIGAATLAALAAVVLVVVVSLGTWGPGQSTAGGLVSAPFLRTMAIWSAAFGALAILWTALPVLTMPVCS